MLPSSLARAASLAWRFARCAMRAGRPAPRVVLGVLSRADFIPSRPFYQLIPAGFGLARMELWSEPFWAVSISTRDGSHLHACLNVGWSPPELGEPMSVVARNARFARHPARVEAILRPGAIPIQW